MRWRWSSACIPRQARRPCRHARSARLGLLPIALGEATKTVPFVMDGRKIYRFTVRWGEERDTDDAEGRVTRRSAARPQPEQIEAPCCRASPAPSSRCRRASPPSRSRASAPTISRARARWWTRAAPGRDPPARAGRDARRRPRRVRRRMRQGHLCAGAGPRHGPRARLLWACLARCAGPGSARSARTHAMPLRKAAGAMRRPKAAIARRLVALLQPVGRLDADDTVADRQPRGCRPARARPADPPARPRRPDP